MKIIWEDNDIKTGMYVCKNGTVSDFAWHATWTFQIGYYGGRGKSCVICLSDGSVILRDSSIEKITEWLNENEMIPCPTEKMISVIDHFRN